MGSINSGENITTIKLPLTRSSDWRISLPGKLNKVNSEGVLVDCQDWQLGCTELKQLRSYIEQAGLKLISIRSNIPETIVSAAALGHQSTLVLQKSVLVENSSPKSEEAKSNDSPKLLFHEGTLRSGEHLSAEGDVLLLGDVNPGATISAGGNVMIWGRLRGTAQAGKLGDKKAKIIALELRPVQLRIANAIARGPEEKPAQGLTEEALLESGKIIIQPARVNPFMFDRT